MLVEIIDEAGEVVEDGISGEIVVTPLGVEGLPLVRFQTGDISRIHSQPCGCGWNTKRLGPIEGRLSQRLKYKGTTLYPDMILQALQCIPGIEDSYVEVKQRFDLADDITVVIGGTKENLDRNRISTILSSHLRVTPKIRIVSVSEVIEKTGKGKLRKPQRFFDLR